MAQTYVPQKDASVLRVTGAANNYIRQLSKGTDAKLRIYVAGGGCSGFKYCFELDSDQEQDDTVIAQEDVTIAIDAMSLPYITGSILDYREDLEGARFVVDNPLAQTTCGCGASFSI